MRRRLLAMVRKEFSQLFRDVPMLLILIWAFTGGVYTSGHGGATELSKYPIVVYDLSRSPASRELVSRFRAPYFKLVGSARSDAEVVAMLDRSQANLAVVIPPDFERRARQGNARFQVISDGSQSMMATIAGGHIAGIAGDYSVELLERGLGGAGLGAARVPQVDVRPRVAYNPNLTETWFSSLLEVFSQTTMVAMLLAAAAMVREREHGTVEHLLVMPVTPAEIMTSKVWSMGLVVLVTSAVSMRFVVQGWLGIPILGSIPMFLCGAALHVFAVTSLGMFLATFARTMPQFALLMIMVLLPLQVLDGGMTPRESMPEWVQQVMLLAPTTHFVMVGQGILFRGGGIDVVWMSFLALAVIGTFLFMVALARFRRTIGSM
jgi:ABC-2 type transport system permease protein